MENSKFALTLWGYVDHTSKGNLWLVKPDPLEESDSMWVCTSQGSCGYVGIYGGSYVDYVGNVGGVVWGDVSHFSDYYAMLNSIA